MMKPHGFFFSLRFSRARSFALMLPQENELASRYCREIFWNLAQLYTKWTAENEREFWFQFLNFLPNCLGSINLWRCSHVASVTMTEGRQSEFRSSSNWTATKELSALNWAVKHLSLLHKNRVMRATRKKEHSTWQQPESRCSLIRWHSLVGRCDLVRFVLNDSLFLCISNGNFYACKYFMMMIMTRMNGSSS